MRAREKVQAVKSPYGGGRFATWHYLQLDPIYYGRTIIHYRIILKQFPLSMLILGQNSCILGPTIFKIPQPN